MTRKIVILGATGGCVDILDAIIDVNRAAGGTVFDCLGFLDDKAELHGTSILGAPVLGGFARFAEMPADCLFVTGIGSPYNYVRKPAILAALGLPRERFATVIHPSASVSTSARVGLGCVLYHNVVVTTRAVIGDHVLVLPNSVVNHDAVVGDCSIVTSSVSLSGGVRIGRACYIGSNSALRQEVVIGDGAQVGMGSVVLHDVAPGTVVAGVPARLLRGPGEGRQGTVTG